MSNRLGASCLVLTQEDRSALGEGVGEEGEQHKVPLPQRSWSTTHPALAVQGLPREQGLARPRQREGACAGTTAQPGMLG